MRVEARLDLGSRGTASARVYNISFEGLALKSDFELPRDHLIAISLHLPLEPQHKRLRVVGRVHHSSFVATQGCYRTGIKFEPLTPDAAEVLTGFLAQHHR